MFIFPTDQKNSSGNTPLDPGPWRVRWSPALLPSRLVTFELHPGCNLEDIVFQVVQRSSEQMGGDGGEIAVRLDSSTRLEFVIEEHPPPVGSYHPEKGHWRHYVSKHDSSDIVIFLTGTQLESGESWPVAVWWPSNGNRSVVKQLSLFTGAEALEALRYLQHSGSDLEYLCGSARPVRQQSAADIYRAIAMHESLPPTADTRPLRSPAQTFKIEGYRGFRTPQTLELALPNGKPGSGLTVVVGANNAGKSALWEGFDMLSRAAVQTIYFPESRRNSRAKSGVDLRLTRANGTSLSVSAPDRDSSRAIVSLPNESAFGSDTSQEWAVVTVPARRQFRPYFGDHEDDSPNWAVHAGTYSRTELRQGFTGRLISVEKDAAQRTWFDEALSALLGYNVAWSIDAREDDSGQTHYVKIRPAEDIAHSSEGAGEGVVSLMFIADALRDLGSDSVLVIDEPELSLHPEAVRRLQKLLSEKAQDHQIVILTHSPLMLDWQDIANGARVARIHKVDGESKISQPGIAILKALSKQAGNWRTPHTLGFNANEVFFLRDQVIILEGQEDVALFPTVLAQVKTELNGELFGWGASGAANIPNVAQLLKELGFTKVVGIFDKGPEEDRILVKVKKQFPNYKFLQIPAEDMRDKDVYMQTKADTDGTQLYVRRAKPGLLDKKRHVKGEYLTEITGILQQVTVYLDGT